MLGRIAHKYHKEDGIVIATCQRVARRVFLTDLAQAIYARFERVRQEAALRAWERDRGIPPPHLLKQRTVRSYAAAFSLDILVETGTYLGAMVEATKDVFDRIYTIELDGDLCARARRRFARHQHISVIEGDSSQVLPVVLAQIRQPCLFWLDAHYSGVISARGRQESPIMQELGHILNHPVPGHVVLIDDAREFVGKGGYPALGELQSTVRMTHPDWVFEVRDDIIRTHGRG